MSVHKINCIRMLVDVDVTLDLYSKLVVEESSLELFVTRIIKFLFGPF